MKKILNVTGIQELSKTAQQKIKGAGSTRCCIDLGDGTEYCYYTNGHCV